MSTSPYPDGNDLVWLASDREGNVGALITAGMGPIPVEAFKPDYPLKDIEATIYTTPKVTEARVFVSADSFIAIAERGLFVYDWSDIHRTLREALNRYERVAAPATPIRLEALHAELAKAARMLRFTGLSFVDSEQLDVRAAFECLERDEAH